MKKALLYISDDCQYTCDYCMLGDPSYKKRVGQINETKEGVDQIVNFFNTREDWQIHLTGGEPTLHPYFIDLVKKLTEHHVIALDTNNGIGLEWLDDFIQKIDPNKVTFIQCSLHDCDETEERLLGYVNRTKRLLNAGFKVYVSYVATPERIPMLNERMALFKAHDIPFVIVPLRTREYPKNYTEKERQLITEHMISAGQKAYLDLDERHVKNKLCSAGYTRVNIESISGRVRPCWRSNQVIGNIYENTLRLSETISTCTHDVCTYYFEPHAALEELIEEDLADIMSGVEQYNCQRFQKILEKF